MPAWRSPELDAIFGGPLDAGTLSEATLEQLVADRVRESDQLDFKAHAYPRTPRATWSNAEEFAADVAAFANHRGGVLVLGVAEKDAVATALSPITSSTPEVAERRLRQALARYQVPVADTIMYPIFGRTAGEWYLIVAVPPSRRRPHGVATESRGGLHFPIRHGTDKLWMSESEVADRYRARHATAAEDAARADEVVREGLDALVGSKGVWLYVATIPEIPSSGAPDRDTVREIDAWQATHPSSSPMQRSLSALGPGEAAPGRVVFSERRGPFDPPSPPFHAYVELHVDGSAFVSTAIAARSTSKSTGREVGYMTLIDDAIIAVDHALIWSANRTGWGTVTVVAGFYDADSKDAASVATPISLYVGDDDASVRPMRGTRSVRRPPRVTTVADLGFVGTVQQRLAVTHTVLARLLNWFGLPEPEEVLRDGCLVIRKWPTHDYRGVERWARAQGVPTVS